MSGVLHRLKRRRPLIRLSILTAIPALALGAGLVAAAMTPISDSKGAWHSYGGFSCNWGGASQLASAGGSSGGSSTAIFTSSCTNGYRELYTQARTTTNAYLSQYTGWVLYDVGWNYGGRTDLCIVWGDHRMSKAGVDTSSFIFTSVVGCQPA